MTAKDGLICHNERAKNSIKNDVFEREIALCRKLSKDGNGVCGWGTCKECGVIPLLYKLHKGILVEGAEAKSLKKNLLN